MQKRTAGLLENFIIIIIFKNHIHPQSAALSGVYIGAPK